MALVLAPSEDTLVAGGPLRVLMVSDVYLPRINGVSTSINIFRSELGRRGHKVDLLAPDYADPGANTSDHPVAGVEPGLTRIRGWTPWFDREDRLMSGRRLRNLQKQLSQGDYHIVHIQTPFAAHRFGVAIGRRLEIPVVESYHTLFEAYGEHYLPWLPQRWLSAGARVLSRRLCNQVDGVIVPSTAMARTLQAYGVLRPIHTIPTGLEPAAFADADGARFRAILGIVETTPLLLFVGRVAHEKNIDFLLHVLRALLPTHPDARLAIVGDGPARHHLETLGQRLGIARNLFWTGYLPRDGSLRDAYSGANGFVFASQTETQGLVLLEAMAQGLPCIAAPAQGTCDLLEEGAGALLAPLNPEPFAARVATLLGDQALQLRLRAAARHHAAQWSATAAAERLEILYRDVLLTHAGGRGQT
jgi:1,2-diacylglycerol 3-alpha-glucosyltransferase